MKLTDIELLATLENLRISNPNDDYILRVASAIVAENFGYKSRADWTQATRESGLVEYGLFDDVEAAKENYNRLIKKMRTQA